MDWLEALNSSLSYIEEHLLDKISAEEIAEQVYISHFYFQRGFKIMTGYSVAEYVRNRRLFLAGEEIASCPDLRIIDITYKYGYETPDSFTKAFTRFHGITPVQAKNQRERLKIFQRLILQVSVKGGSALDYQLVQKEAFKVIGKKYTIAYEDGYQVIPQYWKEFSLEKHRCLRGMYGLCANLNQGSNTFDYYIADDYYGEEIPKGYEVYEIPAATWAIFNCVGPLPEAFQVVNTKIFKEWLPGNPSYEISSYLNIERYTQGNIRDEDYISEIWVPVRKKNVKMSNRT